MNVKLVVTLLVVAFALFMVITAPQTSADAVHSAFEGVSAAFRSFGTFVSSL